MAFFLFACTEQVLTFCFHRLRNAAVRSEWRIQPIVYMLKSIQFSKKDYIEVKQLRKVEPFPSHLI